MCRTTLILALLAAAVVSPALAQQPPSEDPPVDRLNRLEKEVQELKRENAAYRAERTGLFQGTPLPSSAPPSKPAPAAPPPPHPQTDPRHFQSLEIPRNVNFQTLEETCANNFQPLEIPNRLFAVAKCPFATPEENVARGTSLH